MALEKQTKSFRLAAGMKEHVDDFLSESPSMEYIENGRFDKGGVISKRRGFDLLPSNGLTAADGDPSFLHAIGDSLYTVSNTAVHRFDGTSWQAPQGTGFLAKQEKILSTGPVKGLSHAASIRLPNSYVMTYEVKKTQPGVPGFRSTVIQTYSLDGELLHEAQVPGHRSPKLVYGTSTVVYLLAAQSDENPITFKPVRAFSYDTVTNLVLSLTVDPITGLVADFHSSFGPRPVDANFHQIGDATDGTVQYVAAGFLGAYNIVAYMDNTGGMELKRFDGTFSAESTVESFISGVEEGFHPLAVHATANEYYLMYSQMDIPFQRSTSEVHIRKYLAATDVLQWDRIVSTVTYPLPVLNIFKAGNPTHGTLVAGGNEVFYAFYYDLLYTSGTSIGDNPFAVPEDVGLRYGSLAILSGNDISPLEVALHHRLTTDAVFYDGEVYMGVQQYVDSTPRPPHDRSTSKGNLLLTRPFKPVTTALVRVDVVNNTLTPVATLDPGQSKHTDASEALSNSHLGHLEVDGDVFYVANRSILVSEDVVVFSDDASQNYTEVLAAEAKMTVYSVDVDSGRSVTATGFGDGVLIDSAVPVWFDGNRVLEVTPLDQPEIVRLKQNPSDTNNPFWLYETRFTGEHPEDEWRNIQVVLGYTDSKGNIHRSAPSTRIFATDMASDDDDVGTDIAVYFTAPLTLASPNSKSYFAEVYVSNDANGPPRLAGSAAFDPTDMSDPEVFKVNVRNTLDTAALAGQLFAGVQRASQFLYTEGGVLPADPWPSFSSSIVTSDRMWVLSSELRGTVFYSKLFEEFVAPEFSASLVLSLGDERTLTAMGRLDDKVVVFESDEIHVIYGEGPDNTGRGTPFAIHHVATDVGCVDSRSVVETPKGLVFLSTRGFHLLDRSLNVSYIGGPVEDMARHILVDDATLVSTEAEIRFIVRQDPAFAANDPDGPTPSVSLAVEGVVRPPTPGYGNVLPADPALVWNYEHNAWSVFSNYAGQAATIYQNRYTRIRTDWDVWQESLDVWRDPSGTNALRMVTPWLKMRGLQDFGRLYRLTFLGRYLSSFRDVGGAVDAGDIRVSLRYDYEYPVPSGNPVNSDTKVFQANVAFQLEPRNAQGSVGDPPDARAQRLQFSMRPGRQKVQSVQVEIDEVATVAVLGSEPSYQLGRGFEITAVDIEFGAKPISTRTISAGRKG